MLMNLPILRMRAGSDEKAIPTKIWQIFINLCWSRSVLVMFSNTARNTHNSLKSPRLKVMVARSKTNLYLCYRPRLWRKKMVASPYQSSTCPYELSAGQRIRYCLLVFRRVRTRWNVLQRRSACLNELKASCPVLFPGGVWLCCGCSLSVRAR